MTAAPHCSSTSSYGVPGGPGLPIRRDECRLGHAALADEGAELRAGSVQTR